MKSTQENTSGYFLDKILDDGLMFYPSNYY